MNTLLTVEQYHNRMGIHIANDINLSSCSLNRYRVKVLSDELFKLNYSLDAEDKAGALEYIANLLIELDSTILSLGFKDYKEAAFYEVHQANMTKLKDDGNPVIIGDGRIAITPNYRAPNLTDLIRNIQQIKKG